MTTQNRKLIVVAAIAATAIAVLAIIVGLRQTSLGPGDAAELTAGAADGTDSVDAARAPGGLAGFDDDGDGIVYQDAMHPWYVQDEPGTAPDCGMELTPVRIGAPMEAGTVRIDAATRQNIGVRTAVVGVESLDGEIRTTGRFVMDEQGERSITLKTDGYIERLYADFNGMHIEKGQKLVDVYSPNLVATQEEYLLALRNVERLSGASSNEDAQRLMEAARRRLEYWDLSQEQLRRLEESGTPQRIVSFHAPSSGEVMNKRVAEGDFVRAGEELMQVVDISRIWLIADVYEKDLGRVREGTAAQIELPYTPGVVLEGRVEHVYHMLDTELRAAKARIVLPGTHGGRLKPGMYATVRLAGEATPAGPVVPSEAIVRSGAEELVILSLGDGRFRPVPVVSGIDASGKTQILSGLQGGESIVTSAQFLIDSEARLQSAIGAMTGGSSHQHTDDLTGDRPTGDITPERREGGATPDRREGDIRPEPRAGDATPDPHAHDNASHQHTDDMLPEGASVPTPMTSSERAAGSSE